jgi:hypothetical protein
MSTFKERSKIRKQKMKEQNKADQKEKQRLKALPKPLRKLETELQNHVDFMAVYDGYLGDFTGELVPVDPVKNPFTIIHGMELNFPHPNALNEAQKAEYVYNITNAFNRLGFDTLTNNTWDDVNILDYELVLYFIENPPEIVFDYQTTLKKDDLLLCIERLSFEYFI